MPLLDPRVDTYIKSLPPWQQVICTQARRLIHEAEPEIEETTKRDGLPYFVLKGNVCAFLAARDHVNIFIYDPIAPDPAGIINQGSGNKTARAIQIHEGTTLHETAFINLIRAVANHNRQGGWRRLT